MSETERILDQLHRSYHGNAWHGPALRELLADVTPEQAHRRALPSAHTIAEIVLHIAAWLRFSAATLQGAPLPQDVPVDQDWPPAPAADEKGWIFAQAAMARAQAGLEDGVKNFSEARLSETVLGRKYSFYFLLHGITQHNLYHAGQIALLKK